MLFSQDLTQQSVEILDSAAEEARRRGHGVVTRLHLLGSLAARSARPDIAASRIFAAVDMFDALLAAVEEKLSKLSSVGDVRGVRMSDEIYVVLSYASRFAAEARRPLTTADILLGIVWDGGEPLLRDIGVTIERAKDLAKEAHQIEPGGRLVSSTLVYKSTTGAVRIPAFAHFLAREEGADTVGTHHLLLALFTERDGLARQLLESYGIRFTELRERASQLDVSGSSDEASYKPYTYRDRPGAPG
jgi:ATP-dependent Clp protease ATP-binding subunit ClpA